MLALLHDEPGGESLRPLLPAAVMPSVNWAEVVQKCVARGVDVDGLRSDLGSLGLRVWTFNADDAEASGRLWSTTKALGLSLGDRACLALGQRHLHLQTPIAHVVGKILTMAHPCRYRVGTSIPLLTLRGRYVELFVICTTLN